MTARWQRFVFFLIIPIDSSCRFIPSTVLYSFLIPSKVCSTVNWLLLYFILKIMGRPLFSQSYYSPAAVVRVEPDDTPAAEQPVCERWTYWKPFDPDSEEFFVNEVYEAFVDPVDDVQRDRGPSPVMEESSSSSSSEDESMSGRGTPIGDVIADRAGVEDGRDNIGIRLREGQFEAVVIRRVNEESEERLRRELNQTGPRTIVPIPITVNRAHRAHPPTPTTPHPRSTPPSVSTPLFPMTPSPGLDATPRLYGWRELTSPTRGPLINPTARRSFSHDVARRHNVAV